MNSKTCFVVACAAFFASGCGSDSSTVTVEPHPTIIELAPRDFLGSLTCGTGSGNLQLYVATLTDVTRFATDDTGAGGAPALEFDLPSSQPIRCEQGVAFGLVVPGHFYTARIDGYDRGDVVALAPGTPVMLSADRQSVAPPRWSTECGTPCEAKRGNGPGNACPPEPIPPNPRETGYSFAVRAEYELTRPMQPCWAWASP